MSLVKKFNERVEASKALRARNRNLAWTGQWAKADPDPGRAARYAARLTDKVKAHGREAQVGSTLDWQPAGFLFKGANMRRAVAMVEVNDSRNPATGSGFLISPQLFITNNHVIADAMAAQASQIIFDREIDETGRPRAITSFLLAPDRFALFSPDNVLDYAVVAVGPSHGGLGRIEDFGFCPLSARDDKHALGININIIQHPHGWPKMAALRNNLLTHRTKRTLLYETDTEVGSSGAPVFNDYWEVVALHHWGTPHTELKDENGEDIPHNVNEGIRISAIYRDLEMRLPLLPPDWQTLLESALAYDREPQTVPGSRLGGPRPTIQTAESNILADRQEKAMPAPTNSQELRVVLPLEITIRVMENNVGLAAPASGTGAQGLPAKSLSRGSEAARLDRDYETRAGYNPKFIAGAVLPLPGLSSKLTKQVAPLRAGEPDADAGELKYQNFSIKMHKAKRVAIFTATNIDGETYLEVDRKSGAVKASEGDTWYKDPRVSASFYLDNNFYSVWSGFFDRGHLTRRTDPTWGSIEDAERANADTFHFTNCAPQHFRFNQTTKYWQGVERYVLENGVLATDQPRRLCVFQGPIFDDTIDRWADDVQIPSSFFKVVVWKAAAGLKAVGLVVDQHQLLDEERHYLGQPKDVASVNVRQWCVKITQIEKRTGLNFGDAIRAADTFSPGGQIHVGEEAARPITDLKDIPL